MLRKPCLEAAAQDDLQEEAGEGWGWEQYRAALVELYLKPSRPYLIVPGLSCQKEICITGIHMPPLHPLHEKRVLSWFCPFLNQASFLFYAFSRDTSSSCDLMWGKPYSYECPHEISGEPS